MRLLSRFLGLLGGHGPKVLFGGVFLGLLLPDLAAVARPVLAPAVATLLLLALLRVDWTAMAGYLRRPLAAGAMTLWMLLASPLVMWALLAALPLPEALEVALVLMAAAPPIIGAVAIAMLLGLDGALAMVVALVCTLLTPLTVPPLALALLGLELDVSLVEFMARLAALVLAAFLGAHLLRRLLGVAWLAARSRQTDGLVVLVMLVFALAIMDGVTASLLRRPGTVGLWLAAAFVANPLLQVLGAFTFLRLGLRKALTAGLLSGNCNMGLLLAALPPDTDFDIVLFFAVAQIPMYMLPAMLLPAYRRLLAASDVPRAVTASRSPTD